LPRVSRQAKVFSAKKKKTRREAVFLCADAAFQR